MIVAENIAKSYGATEALRKVSFEVGKGEIFGIIGPDGAGKTTLFRILTTLILADNGKASIAGLDVVEKYREIRRHIGYMPGKFSIYQDMTVEENLNFFATLFNTSIEKNYHLVKDIYVQIEPFRKRRAGALSGGMKQKLALCCALIHKPDVLFLDEPTTGIDPVSRKELWAMLKRLKQQNITILVSTPYMDEATLCDRIALIKDGMFMKIDSPAGIIASFGEILWAVKGDTMSKLLKDLRQHNSVSSSFAFGDVHHITVNEGFTVEALAEYLVEKGNTGLKIYPIKPDIEDCYMQLAKS
jgi:ABC-type multidrug transport system ATPase subunit